MAETRKRNAVFIISDQQRHDTMRCYGNEWIQTPSLNALATQSFVFQRAYVTQPVCTPSRASLVTGLTPHTAGPTLNKMVLSPEVRTIAEMVSDDYICGYLGKWHLGNDVIPQHGFDVWISAEDGHRAEYTKREYRSHLSDHYHFLVSRGFQPDEDVAGARIFSAWGRSQLPEDAQMPAFLAGKAEEFIEANKDRPFVLCVSTFEPHPPYNGPFNDMYDPTSLPVGPTFLKRPEGAALLNRVRADYYLQYLNTGLDPSNDRYVKLSAARGHDVTTEAGWRYLRACYLANVTLVDRMVGRIVAALEKAGVADNTAFVFTSDHGEMAGDHGMLEKRAFYEESSRVPLLIRVPWLANEQRDVPGNVGQVDLVPTLLDLLEQPIPEYLEGKSIVPVLRDEKTLQENDVFMEWTGISRVIGDRFLGSPAINRMIIHPWRSVVSENWKLNLCAFDQCELFDLKSDPYEQHNLFNDPGQKDRIRDLAARVRLWQFQTRDDAPLPSM
ncbi:MAG: sulfatase-like hydrolase/transferase [Chloroflexota bacterium]|nr:sulfatase-like hydrolase/transferase [Chloroflexota bacterium]